MNSIDISFFPEHVIREIARNLSTSKMPGIDYSPEPNRPKGMYVCTSIASSSSKLMLTRCSPEIPSYVGATTVRSPTSSLSLGLLLNNLSLGLPKQKNITSYTLSATRQRPFAGAFHNAIFNTARRVRGQVLYVAPPFVVAYVLISWMEERCVFFFIAPTFLG